MMAIVVMTTTMQTMLLMMPHNDDGDCGDDHEDVANDANAQVPVWNEQLPGD